MGVRVRVRREERADAVERVQLLEQRTAHRRHKVRARHTLLEHAYRVGARPRDRARVGARVGARVRARPTCSSAPTQWPHSASTDATVQLAALCDASSSVSMLQLSSADSRDSARSCTKQIQVQIL